MTTQHDAAKDHDKDHGHNKDHASSKSHTDKDQHKTTAHAVAKTVKRAASAVKDTRKSNASSKASTASRSDASKTASSSSKAARSASSSSPTRSSNSTNAKTSARGTSKPKPLSNMLKTNVVQDMQKGANSYLNAASNTVSKAANVASSSANTADNFINKMYTSVSKTIEENISLGQGLLSCRDAKDLMDFQKKVIEVNISSSVNFCRDFTSMMQDMISKNFNMSNFNNSEATSRKA